jgi:uncharacterized protein YjbJ (UPF0337 family)
MKKGKDTTVTEDSNAAPGPESGLEASVKGIGQGIAGKFKEMLGEFIDDPNLEQEGIVQQLDGRIRRAESESEPEPEPEPEPPSPSDEDPTL